MWLGTCQELAPYMASILQGFVLYTSHRRMVWTCCVKDQEGREILDRRVPTCFETSPVLAIGQDGLVRAGVPLFLYNLLPKRTCGLAPWSWLLAYVSLQRAWHCLTCLPAIAGQATCCEPSVKYYTYTR